MSSTLSKRQLFARLRGGPKQLRPPWSKQENEFTELCAQCGDCEKACPQEIIVQGHAGYPIVDFSSAGCTFCGACADSCDYGCFLSPQYRTGAAWSYIATVSDLCVETKGVSCRMCEEACDSHALRFRPRAGGKHHLIIDPESCTGCGACISLCPVEAISIREAGGAEGNS